MAQRRICSLFLVIHRGGGGNLRRHDIYTDLVSGARPTGARNGGRGAPYSDQKDIDRVVIHTAMPIIDLHVERYGYLRSWELFS